jgi:hypothetical protein
MMRKPMQLRKAWEKIISALAQFDYLTAAQVTRLLYAPTSLTHVQEQMKLLVDASLVITLGGKALDLPLIYALSGTGRQYAYSLGAPARTRFQPSEVVDAGHNPYFLKHTMSVIDVLIAARLLSQTHLSGSRHLARPKHRCWCWNDKMALVRTFHWRRNNAGIYDRITTRSYATDKFRATEALPG